MIPLVLLAAAATLSFLAAGYLIGVRAGGRARESLRRSLARTRDERLSWERERGGLIAELATAQAEEQILVARNTALIAQIASRPVPPARLQTRIAIRSQPRLRRATCQ